MYSNKVEHFISKKQKKLKLNIKFWKGEKNNENCKCVNLDKQIKKKKLLKKENLKTNRKVILQPCYKSKN